MVETDFWNIHACSAFNPTILYSWWRWYFRPCMIYSIYIEQVIHLKGKKHYFKVCVPLFHDYAPKFASTGSQWASENCGCRIGRQNYAEGIICWGNHLCHFEARFTGGPVNKLFVRHAFESSVSRSAFLCVYGSTGLSLSSNNRGTTLGIRDVSEWAIGRFGHHLYVVLFPRILFLA